MNTPPSSGTALKTFSSESLNHRRTRGLDVHIATYSASRTPASSARSLKNAAGIARGSFIYRYTLIPNRPARSTSFFRFSIRRSAPFPNSG